MIDYYVGLALALAFVYFFNVPFGYWRANTRKFTKEWAMSIHIPVVAVIIARFLVGAPWNFIPVFVGIFFLGQFTGRRIRRLMLKKKNHLSSCLVMDLLRYPSQRSEYRILIESYRGTGQRGMHDVTS